MFTATIFFGSVSTYFLSNMAADGLSTRKRSRRHIFEDTGEGGGLYWLDSSDTGMMLASDFGVSGSKAPLKVRWSLRTQRMPVGLLAY